MTFLTIFLIVWFAISAVGVLSFCAISAASALLPSFEGFSEPASMAKMAVKRNPGFASAYSASAGKILCFPLTKIHEDEMDFVLNGQRFLGISSPARAIAA